MHPVVIAGCGYVGERLARGYLAGGQAPLCTVRSAEHAQRLESAGLLTRVCSLDDVSALPSLECGGAVLFYLVPPPGGGTSDTRAANFIALLRSAEPPRKIIYMSATSVYNETSGGVVTESSPAEPASAMGKRRLDAERSFQAYGAEAGVPVIILRVSGIYGPGRLPLMQISQGQPLLAEAESGLSNRIHVDDLVAICRAAADQVDEDDLFNVSDGHPSSMTSYFNLCADCLGYPRQPQVSMSEAHQLMSPLMLSYVRESRCVDSSRMIEKLGISLLHPDMHHGVPVSCTQQKV